MITLFQLPAWSAGPTGELLDVLEAVKAAGYEGIQSGSSALCAEVGLRATTSGRVNAVGEIGPMAETWAEQGFDCATLHVGWGFESDVDAHALIDDVIGASDRYRIPLYVETHRATLAQDSWRTVQLAAAHQDLRFNADLSHWYTGHEMVYGDFDAKLAFIEPVLDRVRYFHGRIGDPGCIQVDIGDGVGRPHVEHFRAMWTRCMSGFLGEAGPGDVLVFAPELLPTSFNYARTVVDATGNRTEECDRWQQALVLCDIARACFAAANEELQSSNA